MLKDQLQADLKTAMLARDTERVEVIKSLKSAILYAEVAMKKRDEGLDDNQIIDVIKKESKKRQDAASLYRQGGNDTSADKELAEKAIIDSYLPPALSEEELQKLIDEQIAELSIDVVTRQDMGKIIGAVKAKGGNGVDGALLASLVSQRITS